MQWHSVVLGLLISEQSQNDVFSNRFLSTVFDVHVILIVLWNNICLYLVVETVYIYTKYDQFWLTDGVSRFSYSILAAGHVWSVCANSLKHYWSSTHSRPAKFDSCKVSYHCWKNAFISFLWQGRNLLAPPNGH